MTTQELETFDVININNVVSTLLLGDPDNFRADVLKYAAGKLCFEDLYTRAIDCNVWPEKHFEVKKLETRIRKSNQEGLEGFGLFDTQEEMF